MGARERTVVACAALCAVSSGCMDDPEPPSFHGPSSTPVQATAHSPNGVWNTEPVRSKSLPLTTGTLAVTDDGGFAVVSDPDRDIISVVDLSARVAQAIATETTDQIGRVITLDSQIALVVARGTGQLIKVDLDTASIVARFDVCSAPQGLAGDVVEGLNVVHVACRFGDLVTLDVDSGERLRELQLDDDLRDIVVLNDALAVSRFRSAEVLMLDAAGTLTRRLSLGPSAQTAWRMIAGADGQLILAHQSNTVGRLPFSFLRYYGSGGCSGSISQPVLSVIDPSIDTATEAQNDAVFAGLAGRIPLQGSAGVIDVARHPISGRLTVTVPGNALGTQGVPSVFEVDPKLSAAQGPDCSSEQTAAPSVSPVVAVSPAFLQDGTLILQSREPAEISFGEQATIHLSDVSVDDTGFRLFHMNTSQNIACASCHPEGREDGYTWDFPQFGLRRTQSLEGGVSHLAPFHWDGLLEDLRAFSDEILNARMGLTQRPSDAELQVLGDWLDQIPSTPLEPPPDAAAVTRGQQLFEDANVGCSSCHQAPYYTDNRLHDVGTGGEFVTPPLVGIRLRAPFMHDGCANSLPARFGACGGGDDHGSVSSLSQGQIDDLVAFMESL